MNDIEMIDPRLEAHLRRTLNEVARTVPSGQDPSPARNRRRVPMPVMLGVAVAILSAGAAFAWTQLGHEYVKQLPPGEPIAAGTTGGIRWWLVPSFHTDVCDQPFSGVEVVADARNRRGQEWDTFGVNYGEPSADPCVRDEGAWLRDPTRMDAGVSRMGDDDDADSPWIGAAALHPSVSGVLVTVDGSTREVPTQPRPDRPDGPRYAVFTAPAEARSLSITLLGPDGTKIGGERSFSL